LNWKEDLIKYRREKAAETLADARLLYKNKRLFSAVNRIYYSMFYEVVALLQHEGLTSKKHSGVLAVFQRSFIKTNRVTLDMGKFYSRMFEFRHKGDYGDFIQFEEEKVKEWIDKAELFIKEIERLF
jgi:uncharacterized protein (UPF0332 family)